MYASSIVRWSIEDIMRCSEQGGRISDFVGSVQDRILDPDSFQWHVILGIDFRDCSMDKHSLGHSAIQ